MKTSYDWVEYFYQNAREPELPWNSPCLLSGAERNAVLASIQQFQLGEGASGTRMLEKATAFCRTNGDLGLIAALRLFLREEQRHAEFLARFLRHEHTSCLQKHWVHGVFRQIRGLAGLELFMKVLVTAELIARPYYAALRDATGSPLLRSICQRILEEEAAHIRFQFYALVRFEGRHSPVLTRLIRFAHAGFLACTALVVWREHRSVFAAANRTFAQFCTDVRAEFNNLYQGQLDVTAVAAVA